MPPGDPPLTLRDLRGHPAGPLQGRRRRARGTARRRWSCTPSSTCCSTTHAAGSTARSKSDIAALAVGEEATVFAEVRTVHSRRTRQGRCARGSGRSRRHVDPHDHVLQPAVAREAAHRRHRGVVLRQARRVPRQAADDEPRRRRHRPRRRGRREDRRDRSGLPAVGQGRSVHVAAARAGGRRAREVQGARVRRSARRAVVRPRRPPRPQHRVTRDPPSGVDGREERGGRPA